MRTVGVTLTADVSRYMSQMQRAGLATKGFVGEMDKAAKGGHLDQVADKGLAMGSALALGFGYAVKSAADFDKEMSAVSAATHAGNKEMDQLRQAALAAGKDTQYSATEAAKGITELSKAGVSTADILGGGLKGSLALAAAGQLDVGAAAETAASALTQFKLKGSDIPHVADLLAAGAGKAQGSVADLSGALNQVGLIAAGTGLSIEDTTGTLAAFASAGLTGSDAGTSFKTMLQALQAPSGKTKELMDELGISAYDAQGNFIGITALAGQLRTQLGKLTPEMRANAMAQIFGSDATRAANILYEQGQSGIQGWIDKTNDAGYASETAAKLTDNLAGDLERLKGSLETMAIEGGSGANSGLRVITKSVGALVDQFGQLPPAIGGTVTVLAGVGGAALLAGAGWIKMRRSVTDALTELRETGPVGTRAATTLEKTGKVAGKAAAGFAAMQIAAAAASAAFGNDLTPQLDALSTGLQRFADSGKVSGEAARLFGGDMGKLDTALKDIGDTGRWSSISRGIGGTVEAMTGAGAVFDDSLEHSRQRLQALDAALQQLVTGGHGDQAAAIFKQIAIRAREQGVSVAELQKVLPGYTGSLETAAAGANKMGSAAQAAGAGTDDLGAAAEKAKADLDALNKSFKSLFDAQMSSDRAQIKYQEGLVALRTEMTKGSRTLDLNSAEGRKNRGAVLDQLSAIEDLREARRNEGQTLDVVNKKYKTDVDGLRKSMLQAGFSKKAVDELIGSYRAIPSKVPTSISTPGLPGAAKGIKSYDAQLDKLTRTIKTHVSVEGDKAAYASLKTLLIAQQAAKNGISLSQAKSSYNKQEAGSGLGGSNGRRGGGGTFRVGGWTGPGGEFDEAGVVHADEHVTRKTSRRRMEARHPGVLDYINEHGDLPGYAGGGIVMPFPVNVTGTKIPSMAQAMSVVSGVGAGSFGNWPSSPGAQRGDSGVWRKIVALVRASGIPFEFGNGYRPGDPLWHGSGRAVDFMGFNQDRLAQFFMARQGSVLELIHRTKNRDYGLTRGHYNAMPHQWPLHRNHLHVAMKAGGTISEPIQGVGASGTTYSFGENWQGERLGVTPNWQAAPSSSGGGGVGPHHDQPNRQRGGRLAPAGDRAPGRRVHRHLPAGRRRATHRGPQGAVNPTGAPGQPRRASGHADWSRIHCSTSARHHTRPMLSRATGSGKPLRRVTVSARRESTPRRRATSPKPMYFMTTSCPHERRNRPRSRRELRGRQISGEVSRGRTRRPGPRRRRRPTRRR